MSENKIDYQKIKNAVSMIPPHPKRLGPPVDLLSTSYNCVGVSMVLDPPHVLYY